MVTDTIEILGPSERRYRWIVLAAVWLLYASFGLCNRSIPPIVTPILKDLDMTYSEMGFILGSWQLVYIPVAVFAGIAIDKWGIRKALFTGAMIIAFSEGLRYFATGFFTLLPLVALFGIGGPLISIGAPKVVSSWFKGNDQSAAVGIYTTAPWIGALFAVSATNSIVMPLTGNNWRLTLLSYGIIALIFAVTWGIFARNAKQPGEAAAVGLKQTIKGLLKVPNIRIIIIAGLLTLLSDHGFTQWLPKMLENRGYTPEEAGFLAAIPLVVAIPSVLLLPRYIPAKSRGRFLALIAILASAGLFISYTAPSWLRIFGLVIYGISVPSLLPLLMLLLMNEPAVGEKHMGIAGGLFFCIAEAGGFIGPLLMGKLVDITESFLPGILIFTGTSIILCITTLFLNTGNTSNQSV